MYDIIVVVKPHVVALDGTLVRQDPQGIQSFPVDFYRLSSQEDLDQILSGKRIADLAADHVLDKGQVHSPNGDPLPKHSLGSGVPSSYTDAIKLAFRALQNPNSEVRQKGLSESTPVLVWTPPGKVQRVEYVPEEPSEEDDADSGDDETPSPTPPSSPPGSDS